MFTFAIFLGIYAYLIFFLGIFGLLYQSYVLGVTIAYFCLLLFIFKQRLFSFFLFLWYEISLPAGLRHRAQTRRRQVDFARNDKVIVCLSILLLLQILVNVIGALGPELAFDALWYHLTLPKLATLSHTIRFISGGLFYYSVMPQLTEMLYVPALMFGNEIVAKLIHFSFGLLTCFVLYAFSRKFLNKKFSLLAVIIFYSNLVVDWESITAYVDLARGFFELLSLFAFSNFIETQNKKWFFLSAVLLGFAISTKLLALGSLGIFIMLFIYLGIRQKEKIKTILNNIILFSLTTVIIPLPWFIFSFISTDNLVYPFFTKTYVVGTPVSLVNPLYFLQSLWNLFTHSPDPLSPLYLMFLPLIMTYIICLHFPPHLNPLPRGEESKKKKLTLLILYSALSLLVWYITPNTGGGRFIIPYLPVYSLLIASVFAFTYPSWFKKLLFAIVMFTALISIGYRGLANKKYIPVIVGKETKSAFLAQNLNYAYGDFYDTDQYFEKHIKQTDRVLLYGFHNLYYIDFPFVDSSYIQKGDRFNYIAMQHGMIPKRFANLTKIYHNDTTDVSLYTLPNNKWISY